MIRVLVGGWRADLASQTTPHSVEVSRNWSKTRAGSTLSPSFRVPDSTVQKPHPLSISSLFPLWGRDQVVRIVLFVSKETRNKMQHLHRDRESLLFQEHPRWSLRSSPRRTAEERMPKAEVSLAGKVLFPWLFAFLCFHCLVVLSSKQTIWRW